MADSKQTLTPQEIEEARLAYAEGLPPEVAAVAAAQAEEYGTWVATQPIFFGGARAHNTGDAVPKSNVEAYGWDQLKLVARRDTKAAKAATGEGE